jgi:hypothetical protein
MNKEFKRMMELAGLTEIKVQPKLSLEDVETLEKLEKILRSAFRASNITLEDEAETEDKDAYIINIDDIEIAPGAYQLWDVYDLNTNQEISFASTPELMEWLKDKIK